jgi:gamma-glutamyltranspeptidase/glutathione hydrolase
MHRTPAIGKKGLVASGHPLATAAGIEVLKNGGTAIDAAIAVSSVLTVVMPSQSGIGGDLFCLFTQGNRVKFLNCSGYAGSLATPEHFKDLKRIPVDSPFSITVPGLPYGWYMLSKLGSMNLKNLLSYSIEYAKKGFKVSNTLEKQICANLEKIRNNNFLTQKFYNKKAGDLIINKELGNTIENIAENPINFYTGNLSEKIANFLENIGSLIILKDLHDFHSFEADPINTNYRGYKIFETPPNTQGAAALIMLRLLEEYALDTMKEEDVILKMIDAKKIAFSIRDKVITDPLYMKENVNEYIEKPMLKNTKCVSTGDGDTVYFAIIDKEGNAISCIQSLYYSFGSGFADPATGIIFQSRGAYFSLDPEHINFIKPRKRTMHTLTAGMAYHDNDLFLVFGTSGADGQPQTHVQLIHNIIDKKMNPQAAVEYPRFVHGRVMLEDNPETLRVESRFKEKTIKAISKRYNVVKVAPFDDAMGDSNVIMLSDGKYIGGSDPRRESLSLGY